jgi:hypothetical protein
VEDQAGGLIMAKSSGIWVKSHIQRVTQVREDKQMPSASCSGFSLCNYGINYPVIVVVGIYVGKLCRNLPLVPWGLEEGFHIFQNKR